MANEPVDTGLAIVNKLYRDRTKRVKQLKEQGKKIIGYFCCYTPIELFTALDLVPYRIMGNVKEPLNRADAYIEPVACSFVRSCIDLAMKGDYAFLDGLVMSECCDSLTIAYNILTYNLKLPYSYYLMVPHMLRPASFDFFRAELAAFKKNLEEFAKEEASDQKIMEAIQLHNENRALLRDLYQLRKPDPPLISGVEAIKIIIASMSLPVRESNQLIRNVIQEIKERPIGLDKKRGRILIYGAQIDDPTLIDLIEEIGAYVVMDDLCVGSRYYWHNVENNEDHLNSLSNRYLGSLTCPRTYRAKIGSHQEDLENRFGYLLRFVKDFNVNGVIVYFFRNCDTFAFDAPDVRDYLQQAGLPVLYLEEEYNMNSLARLKTRIQAFLEIIG
jgi:benzoyl-CoA reductase subunit C